MFADYELRKEKSYMEPTRKFRKKTNPTTPLVNSPSTATRNVVSFIQINPTTRKPIVDVYRGGKSFKIKEDEVKVNSKGFVKTTHGVSVNMLSSNVSRFGGAYKIESIPEGLKIIQRGQNFNHYEIVPQSDDMTIDSFQRLLDQIIVSEA